MTTIIRNNDASNIHINNKPEAKVVKSFADINPADVAAEMGEPVKTGVSFDKPATEPEVPVEQATEITTQPELTAAEKIAQRRAEFKRAADIEKRAMQMQKEAQAKLQQAKHFEDLKAKAKDDPIEIAKALGVDPTEFLRLYQNKMYNINEEPKKELTPEEEMKQRLEKLEQDRQAEAKRNAELQSQYVRNNYIQNKILPVISADKEKFQILNQSNIEVSANFMYDMMNDHFMRTGEELNAADVAEEMENQLLKELEDKLQSARKLGKLSKYFKEEVVAETEQPAQTATTIVKPQTKPLGSPKTLSDSMGAIPSNTIPVSPQRPNQRVGSREDRLKKVMNKFGR